MPRAVNVGASADADRATHERSRVAPSPPTVGVPSAWQQRLSESAIELIRDVGIYRLGGNDGCPCTAFEVQNVAVDVSCHKSGSGPCIYIETSHADWCDEKTYKADTRLLAPIAEEVRRQVDAYYCGTDDYGEQYRVRFGARGETP